MTTRRRLTARIAFLATTVILGVAMLLHGQATQPAAATDGARKQGEKFTTADGVEVVITEVGQGATDQDVLWVHYTGKLTDGTKVDSSYDRGDPINLVLGEGRVIAGWEQGLRGMQVGEKRTVTIPPNLAYGTEGRPPKIPANATLVFDLELMGIQRK